MSRGLSRKESVAPGKLIRDAVERLLLETYGLSREERWDRALAAVASAGAGPEDLSTDHDAYFEEACEDDDSR